MSSTSLKMLQQSECTGCEHKYIYTGGEGGRLLTTAEARWRESGCPCAILSTFMFENEGNKEFTIIFSKAHPHENRAPP